MTTPPSSRTPEPSIRALAARLAALEARMADIEGPVLTSQYRMNRRLTRNELRMERLLEHFGVEDVSDDEVDARLDED